MWLGNHKQPSGLFDSSSALTPTSILQQQQQQFDSAIDIDTQTQSKFVYHTVLLLSTTIFIHFLSFKSFLNSHCYRTSNHKMRIRTALLVALSSTAILARSVPGADAAAISGYTLPIGPGARSVQSLDSKRKLNDAPKNSLAARGMPHFVESGPIPLQPMAGDIPLEPTGPAQPIQPKDENEDVATVVVTSVQTLTETPPAPPSSTSQSSQIPSDTAPGASQVPLTSDSTTSPVYRTKTVTITESERRHGDETASQSPSLTTFTVTVTHAPALFPHPGSANWPKGNATATMPSGSTSAAAYVAVSTSSCSSPVPVKTECGCLIPSVISVLSTSETTIQTAYPSSSTTTSSKSDVAVVTMSGPLGVSAVTITYSPVDSWSATSSSTVRTNTTQTSWIPSSWTPASSSTAAHSVTVTVQTQTPVSIPHSNPGSRLSPHPIFFLPCYLLKTLTPLITLSYLPATNAESSIYHIGAEVDRRNTTEISGNLNNINVTVTKDVTCTSSLDNGTFTVGCQKSGAPRSVAVPAVLAFPVHLFKTARAQLQLAKRTCYGDAESSQEVSCSASSRSLFVPSMLTFPGLLIKQVMAWPEAAKRTCYGDAEGSSGVSCSASSRSTSLPISHILSFPSIHSTLFVYVSTWLFCAVAGAVGLAWFQGWLYAGSGEWERVGKELVDRAERAEREGVLKAEMVKE